MLRNPTRLLVSEVSHQKPTMSSNKAFYRLIAVIAVATMLLLTGIGILDETNDTGYQEHWMEIDHKPSTRLFVGVF